MYISLLCQLKEPRSTDTPVAASIPSAQIFVSHTILQQKVRELLGEMADSRPGAGNIQDK